MFFLSRRGGDACIALAGQAFSHRGRCKHPLPYAIKAAPNGIPPKNLPYDICE